MKKFLETFFRLKEAESSIAKEFLAGTTTFFSMVYIIIVHPKILEAGGLAFGASMVVTILVAFTGTLLMGIYANRPFAIAPYMGENAFIAFTVVGIMKYTWEQAFAAVFISGIIFIILTLIKIREWLVNSIPTSLKISFTTGIGLFLTFIGLIESKIIVSGFPGTIVHIGNLKDPKVQLAIIGLILTGILMIKKVKASILISIVVITILSVFLGYTKLPEQWFSYPPDISGLAFKLDFSGFKDIGFFPVILTILVMVFVDTMGTLIGLSRRAKLLDKEGNLPQIEKPMLCDAFSTAFAGLLGTTTAGAFIESATGIESGGRTGLTSVFTAFLFLITLFLAPILVIVPPYAYAPALIIVGMLMFGAVTEIDFSDLSEVLPAFVVITVMCFSYNLGIGMTAGFVTYPLVKLLTGKSNQVPAGLWVLFVLSVLFFIFYPY